MKETQSEMVLDKLSRNYSNKSTVSNGFNIRRQLLTYRVELAMVLVLMLLFILLQIITGTALTSGNIKNVLQAATPIIIVTFGQLLVILTAGIDLSVGSVFSLSGIVGAAVMESHGIAMGVIAALMVGTACGAINGFLVVKAKLAPFIVTLAMYSAAASLAFIATNGNSKTITFKSFSYFDQGSMIPGLPNFILYIIVAFVIFHFTLRHTLFGRWLYATGSNEEAARLVGVPTTRVIFISYTLSGLLTAVAALLNASFLMTVEGTAGQGLELQTIAAVVIGGASLFGGVGSVLGALIGALIQVEIGNGINLLGINSFWSGTVTGCVIIIAVLMGTRGESGKSLFSFVKKFKQIKSD